VVYCCCYELGEGRELLLGVTFSCYGELGRGEMRSLEVRLGELSK
jgi:hypothetical protein